MVSARGIGRYGLELVGIAVTYFVLAKLGLALASINPSASPIWPPTGFALASVLLWGYRVWPAILLAAFVVNATTAGSLYTSAAIAAGNTLECLVGGYLINLWSDGRNTFDTPAGVVRFALISLFPSTVLSATIGVGALSLAGYAEWANFVPIWMTWWLGDLTGALVITPAIVLWLSGERGDLGESGAVFAATVAVGIFAFSPLLEPTTNQAPLGFLAILPLIWAALARGPRDTATVALILSCFAVWGTMVNAGPFARATLNESFLLLLMFMISTTVPSLALSADVAVRKRAQENLRRTHEELDHKVRERTAALAASNRALETEIEQKKRAETELQQQRVQLLEAQRLANLGSWVWDVAQNRVTWSEVLYEIYGVRPDEFRGTFDDFLQRIHEDDRTVVKEKITEALRLGQGFRVDERIIRPNGEIRYLQSFGEVIKNDRGEVVQMLGICQDVTEQHESHVALEQARDQLAQAQKMEALGQLTGGVAHDFNNLLMIVSGHADMMHRRVSEPKDLRALESIQTAANRGAKLTRQLLTFARRQRLTPTIVDLQEHIEAMREMLGSSLRGDIKLELDIPEDTWPAEIDIGEFELALVNLAVNARDAMPDGGTITLSARNVSLQPLTEPGGLEGDFIALALTDTGVGIPPAVIAKIFEPFFTTKAPGKGTGLGLSQVYGFAHQSGGAVAASSEPGKGTTITIYLPRGRAVASPALGRRDILDQAPAEGTILVVEDNPEVAEVTVSLLKQLGYRVLRANSAVDALKRLQRDEINLVFSDIVMPGGMNGIELAQRMRDQYPRIPILLTSGYSDAAQAAETDFAILRKPFEPSLLEKAVREALANARLFS
jgi:PAS domain S-box-containing protein